MTELLTDENRTLMRGLILSLVIHGMTISLIRLHFPTKPEPGRPQMFFLGPIIHSSNVINQADATPRTRTRDLLFKTEPKLFLRGVATNKPGRFTPTPYEKSYLKDNFLSENKNIPLPEFKRQHHIRILPLEPYRRLRLQN